MKRIFKWIALILALALVGLLLVFYAEMAGNPLCAYFAQRNAKIYLAEAYQGLNYETEKAVYNFKFKRYDVTAQLPGSPDSIFTVTTDAWGRVLRDDYDFRVAQRQNTIQRLEEAYDTLVEAVLESPLVPYEMDICIGRFQIYGQEAADEAHSLVPEELEPDAAYDLTALGAKAGVLTLYVWDDSLTSQRMAEVLLDIRQRMDEAGLAFHTIELTLQTRKDPDGQNPMESLCVMGVAYEDIAAENLLETVEDYIHKTQDYFDQMDAKEP